MSDIEINVSIQTEEQYLKASRRISPEEVALSNVPILRLNLMDAVESVLEKVGESSVEIQTTPRGFSLYADFPHKDYESLDEERFTVQESSLAIDRKVWIGQGEHRAHLNEDEARRVRDALTAFLEGK